MFKCPLYQLVRIEKALAFRCRPQYDGVQLLPVFVDGARERSAGLLSVARFNADGIIVDIEETVGGFKEHIGGGPASLHRDSGGPAADNRTERLVGHGIGNHFRLVGSSGMQVTVVLVEVEAMRVLVNRVRATELLRSGVHLRNERLHIGIARGGAARPQSRAHRFGDGDGGIVSRRHQQRVQCRFQRHGVAFLQAGGGLAHRSSISRNGDSGIQGRQAGGDGVERHHARHDLRDRGDACGIVGVTLEIHGAVRIHHDRAFGVDVRALRDGQAASINRFAHDDVRFAHIGVRIADAAGDGGEGQHEHKHARDGACVLAQPTMQRKASRQCTHPPRKRARSRHRRACARFPRLQILSARRWRARPRPTCSNRIPR